eukprot:12913753-Ditylum_brightwellii.AAC.1
MSADGLGMQEDHATNWEDAMFSWEDAEEAKAKLAANEVQKQNKGEAMEIEKGKGKQENTNKGKEDTK